MKLKLYRPSTGTEGELFVSKQCTECCSKETCEIPMLSMLYEANEPEYPKEWVVDSDGKNPRCTARTIATGTNTGE